MESYDILVEFSFEFFKIHPGVIVYTFCAIGYTNLGSKFFTKNEGGNWLHFWCNRLHPMQT